ncbi:uroporphyrinogen-III synthase [Methyloglobulus sp.]|uniref:uroporphyrinogen-III synthase n=1 Tax=Methyloglobulus sp. TaxID=2518622 RepID=UPI003988E8A8
MNNALNGAHVLVTRPVHQAENLCRIIEQQGGIAVRFPTLQIVGLDNISDSQSDNLSAATNPLIQLSKYRWLIFTSANAVNFALKANGGKIARFQVTQIAAIGQATAKELELAGLQATIIPEQGYDSESLLAMPQLQHVNGQGILIVRGQGGREELANVLRSRGANVEYWEVYKRVIPDYDSFQVISLLGQDKLDVVIITSCEALQNLLAMLGTNYKKRLAMVPLVVISERIRQLAGDMGFMRIAVTECPSDLAILDAAIAVIIERGNKRGIEWLN